MADSTCNYCRFGQYLPEAVVTAEASFPFQCNVKRPRINIMVGSGRTQRVVNADGTPGEDYPPLLMTHPQNVTCSLFED